MGDLRIRDPIGGSNQSGLRDQNARLVLSFIRRHGAMSSAEIARRSGLSAQTVSNIVRALEGRGLLQREAAVKGRVGKPSIPMALNPVGVYALGLSIGRRTLEIVLVDFHGKQIDAEVLSYTYPNRQQVFDFVERRLPAILKRNGLTKDRITGLGIARPNRIWEWVEFVKAPDGAMEDWKDLDIVTAFADVTGLAIVLENDATAACVAEQLLGRGHELHDFGYFFLGAFVGGGLVLNGKVISGRTHNAAAFGPLPVPDGKGGTVQLLDVASLHVLESALHREGKSSEALRSQSGDWAELEPLLSAWIEKTGQNLAIAAAAITSVVEVEAILVAGAFPESVRDRLTEKIRSAFSELDVTGIEKPAIEHATVGPQARSIGAALLPIHANYFVA